MGKITFKAKGRVHNISFKDMRRTLGLRDVADFHLPKLKGVSRENNIPSKVWGLISGRKHTTGSDKSTTIRNPAVRYLHRMLVHAFFPRKEPGSVTEDDLRLLCLALHPFAPEELPFYVSELYKDFGMVGFFATRLEYYRVWAWSTTDSEPQIGIVGMITPLLQYVGIDLKSGGVGLTFLDGTHIKIAQYFSGRYDGLCVYTYKKLGKPVEVVLPNKNITSLRLPGTVAFDIGDEHLFGPHGTLGPMAVSKRRRSFSASQGARMHQTEIEEANAEEVYGPPRYYFEPYAGGLAPGPLREAHEHIDKLQRWNKAQDRAFYKLKTKYKELKKTSAKMLKKVVDVLVRGGVAGCRSTDFVMGNTSAPQPQHDSPPHTASQIERARRNFKAPKSASGNKSPSFSSSGDDSGDAAESTPMDHYSAPHSHYNVAYNPYGAPYGGPPYGGAPYCGAPYGGPPYGGTPYGGPSYSGPPHGGPSYGGPPYGGPPYGGAPHSYGGPRPDYYVTYHEEDRSGDNVSNPDN